MDTEDPLLKSITVDSGLSTHFINSVTENKQDVLDFVHTYFTSTDPQISTKLPAVGSVDGFKVINTLQRVCPIYV